MCQVGGSRRRGGPGWAQNLGAFQLTPRLPVLLLTQIRSRAKIEKIRASLFNSSDLIGLSSLDGEDELMEMSTEEILTVSTVNQSLFDTQGSPALEDYFNDKTLKGRGDATHGKRGSGSVALSLGDKPPALPCPATVWVT